jgi:hypothetical protein
VSGEFASDSWKPHVKWLSLVPGVGFVLMLVSVGVLKTTEAVPVKLHVIASLPPTIYLFLVKPLGRRA